MRETHYTLSVNGLGSIMVEPADHSRALLPLTVTRPTDQKADRFRALRLDVARLLLWTEQAGRVVGAKTLASQATRGTLGGYGPALRVAVLIGSTFVPKYPGL